MTEAQLAAAGVPEPARVLGAIASSTAWLDAVPANVVVDGLARAADPAGAAHALDRLLVEAAPRLAPAAVHALLRVLGGSPALAAALAAEGGGWPELLRTVLEEDRRAPAAHRRALEASALLGTGRGFRIALGCGNFTDLWGTVWVVISTHRSPLGLRRARRLRR